MKFDIENKDRKYFYETNNWIDYMQNDVKCLSWTLLNKTCDGYENMLVPKSSSLKNLIQCSMYGGRVIHWKKRFNGKN
jgi:hypothetical protein